MLIGAKMHVPCITGYIWFSTCHLDFVMQPEPSNGQWTSFCHQLNGSLPLVYFDAIIIFSQIVDKHIEHVRIVLSLLHRDAVTLNLKQCKFFSGKMDYLGFVICPGRLEIASYAKDVIHDLKLPKAVT